MEHARVASTAVVLVDNLVVNLAEATVETKVVQMVLQTVAELAVR